MSEWWWWCCADMAMGTAYLCTSVPLPVLGIIGAIELEQVTVGRPCLQLLVAFGYVAIDVTVMLLCATCAQQTNRPKWAHAIFLMFSGSCVPFGIIWFWITFTPYNAIGLILFICFIVMCTCAFQCYLFCKFENLVDTASEAKAELDAVETELGFDILMASNADKRELDSSADTDETSLMDSDDEMASNEGRGNRRMFNLI